MYSDDFLYVGLNQLFHRLILPCHYEMHTLRKSVYYNLDHVVTSLCLWQLFYKVHGNIILLPHEGW